MNNIIKEIEKHYTITNIKEQRKDLSFITVSMDRVTSILEYLKREGFSHLVLLTAVDWIEQNKFQLTYLINNPHVKADIGVRTFIDRNSPVMESIHTMWATAATYQRELKEMFGIDFPGSPGVDEEFILEGWDGPPPYRRDFDTLKYAEETFFPRPGRTKEDPKEYMKRSLYGEWKENKDV